MDDTTGRADTAALLLGDLTRAVENLGHAIDQRNAAAAALAAADEQVATAAAAARKAGLSDEKLKSLGVNATKPRRTRKASGTHRATSATETNNASSANE